MYGRFETNAIPLLLHKHNLANSYNLNSHQEIQPDYLAASGLLAKK